MTTQQRMAAARARSRQQTLERLVDAATGSGVLAVGHRRPGRGLQPRCRGDVRPPAPRRCIGEVADLLFSDAELGRHAARLGSRPLFPDICAASVAAEDDRHLWQVRRPDGEDRTLSMARHRGAGRPAASRRATCASPTT